jgi:hypothetical protein
VVSKIFQTGAAIYTAVVVAQSTSPNRPNCEFRVLLQCFAVTAWKRAKTSAWTLARRDLAASPWQHTISHFRPYLAVSGETQNVCHPLTHCTPLICPLIWHPVTSSYFQKLNWSWKDASLIPLRISRLDHRECLTLWQKRTYRKHSKNGGDGGIGVYMREGTTLRVMAASRPCGEFYDFYSISPEYFGFTCVCWCML